jgi:DNA-binding IclR family transcriptional regulator
MTATDAIAGGSSPGAGHSYYAMRTLRILEILAFASCTATQVAEIINVHPRTARRLLGQFVTEDWAIYDPTTKRYTLNAHLASVGVQSVAHSSLVQRGLPVLSALAGELRTRADLFVPSYGQVASIAHADARGEPAICVGHLMPNHCSAAGRVLLAFREAWRDRVLRGPIEARTARTAATRHELAAILARVRDRGWAFEDGENRDGEASIAAPIWSGRTVVAAIAVTLQGETDGVEAMPETVIRAANALGEV